MSIASLLVAALLSSPASAARSDAPGPRLESMVVLPVTYADRTGAAPGAVGGPTPLFSQNELAEELFGVLDADGSLVGNANLTRFLLDASEDTVEVTGEVIAPYHHSELPYLPEDDDQCGLDLFSSSNADALEDHLAANGYSDLSSVDYLTLVIRCPINTIRGLQTKRWVNGVYLDILLVSAPDADTALGSWAGANPWAHDFPSYSRTLTHEALHAWGLGHAHSVECNEEDLGAGCHNIGYGDPYSIMGDPTGVYSLGIAERMSLDPGYTPVDSSDVLHIEESGTYTIASIHDWSAAARGAVIYWPGTEEPRLLLEHRTPGTFDGFMLGEWLDTEHGLTLSVMGRIQGSATSSGSPVQDLTVAGGFAWDSASQQIPVQERWMRVDPVPDNNSDEVFDHLDVVVDGWSDPYAGIELEVLSVGDESITFTVCFTELPADLDGDGQVSTSDLLALLAAFGSADPEADLDADGTVGMSDLLILFAAKGQTVDC